MGACTVAPHYAIVTEFLSRGSVWSLLHDAPPAPQPSAGAGVAAPSGGRASPAIAGARVNGRTTPTPQRGGGGGGEGGGVVPVPPPPDPLDPRLILRMALDVARGMAYLHSGEQPILHRDLKSGNLLVDDALNVRIADFGLARVRSWSA